MHSTSGLQERTGTLGRSRGAIETKESPTEDHLLEVISDIETRLSHIRESQARRSQLEVEMLERTEELTERETQIETREMSLLAEERAISDRARSVAAENERLEAQRRKMESLLRQLSEKQADLERREHDTVSRVEDVESERRALEVLQRQIETQGTDIAAREALIHAQTEAIDSERRSVEETRARLESERAVLAETARRQAEQSRQLKELAGELEGREREFAQRISEYEALKSQMNAIQSELTSTKKSAASSSEAAKAQQLKAEELQRRCAELEVEREKFRVELSRTRVQLNATPAPQAAPVRLPDTSRLRAPLAIAVWLLATGSAAGAAVTAMHSAALTTGATLFGLVFACMLLANQAIARRLWDTGALPVAVFFGAAGLWFERWVNVLATALSSWELPSGLAELAGTPGLALAAGVLSAGLVANMGLYLVTRSEAVMGNVFFGTILATALVLIPGEKSAMAMAACVGWMALAAGSMGLWSVRVSRGVKVVIQPKSGRVL